METASEVIRVNLIQTYNILSFHNLNYKNYALLGYGVTYIGTQVPVYQN
jgi:hypothetical protein